MFVMLPFLLLSYLTTKAQACGGTDVVKRVIANLTQNTSLNRVCLVDAHGYDAFPALSVMEAGMVCQICAGFCCSYFPDCLLYHWFSIIP